MDSPLQQDNVAWEQTSEQFVGQWNRLVSQTNWEKGRIIHEWRTSLVDAGASPTEYSDETWSRRIGNVSPQHVGRLRRVFERFGTTHEEFEGLYWSHFQAALDWNDAEMWLQGAIDSNWSVSKMRQTRWESIGGNEPSDDEVVSAEQDEDHSPLETPFDDAIAGTTVGVVDDPQESEVATRATKTGTREQSEQETESEDESAQPAASATEPARRAFDDIDFSVWPDDLAESFDELKLAIVRHRMAGWDEIQPQAVADALAGLRDLALSPVTA